jgi:glucose dehydrogenase
VLLATADAHLMALDAHTGKVVWDTTVADYQQGYTFTSGPLAAHGKVVAGIRWAASRRRRRQGIAARDFLTAARWRA